MSHPIVDNEEWLAARRALLEKEKAFQKQQDELARLRRELPWRKVEKSYAFQGVDGTQTLADLFGGSSQLIVYHFMFHPDWEEGCKACSFLTDGYNGTIPHLKARDTNLVAVSRAPLDKLMPYRERLGWSFPWYSSAGNDFNFDFGVSFTPEQLEAKDGSYNYRDGGAFGEEMPGMSVFLKTDDGTIFHTYSTYARGLDPFIVTYRLLDIVPKGRDEEALPFTMAWVRRNDEY